MAQVVLKDVTKTFPGGVQAVSEVSLDIRDKEFLVLVGPSGCGKSTTLRLVAGLEEITSGEIYIGDQLVNDIPPKNRDIAMVFQNYALYPHMTVYKNMAFGLKLRKYPKAEIEERVKEAAQILGIEELLDRIISDLPFKSGDRVSVLINGLGATPYQELYIANRKVKQLLNKYKIKTVITYVGEFFTSLEMAGFSITLTKLDKTLERLILARADAPMFKQFDLNGQGI